MLRNISVLLLSILMAACSSTQSPTLNLADASDEIRCTRTEQVGCLELDLLNFAWSADNPLLTHLDTPSLNAVERQLRAIDLGPRLYEAYKSGLVDAADSAKEFTIYMWDVGDTPISHMSSYRLHGPNGPLTRHLAEEIVPKFGAVFDPSHDIGMPTRAFRVIADVPVAAFQVPWSMIGPQTYILVCANDRLTVYPNRITATDGLWLTPEYLNSIRAKGWEYVLMPHLSISGKS